MAWSLRNLRDKITLRAISKGAVYGFQYLAAKRLGERLNQAMDREFGKDRSDVVQKELAAWLESVAKELRT